MAKALSSIETPIKKKPAKPQFNISMEDVEHKELFETIRKWRHEKHKETNLEHYRILSQKALMHFTQILPQNEYMLTLVNGIGKKKKDLYGTELLKMVKDYCEQNKIEVEPIVAPPPKPKKDRKSSREKSYELYIEGKTISQISEIRGFAKSTIEGHLGHYITTGDIPIEKLVPREKIAIISEKFNEMGSDHLTPVKDALGDDYSYGELRFVRDDMMKMSDESN